jgi:hypothetical protein
LSNFPLNDNPQIEEKIMIKIIVDSTCDLPQEFLQKYDIKDARPELYQKQ